MKRLATLLFLANAVLASGPAVAANTWTGGANANWSNGANWAGGEPGASSAALFNSGLANGTTTPLLIDTTGLKILDIDFDTFGFGVTSNTGYTIGTTGGNALTVSANGAVSILNTFDGADTAETIDAPLTLSGNTLISNATLPGSNDTLVIGGTISDTAATTLTLSGPGAGIINGAITNGSSGLALDITGGTWTLGGANTYAGATTISDSNVTLTGSDASLASNGLINGGGLNVMTYAPTGNDSATQVIHSVTGNNIRNVYVLDPGTTSSADLDFVSISEGNENDYVILGGASSTAKMQFGQPTTTFFNTGSYYGTSLASPSSSYVAYDATLGSFRAINYGVDTGSALSPGGTTIANGATVAGGGSIGSTTYVQTTGAITNQTTTNIHTLTIDGGYNFTIGSGQTLTLNDGGLLKTGGNAAVISGGTLATGNSTSLVIHLDEATDLLTISSAISSSSGGVTKQGYGELILSGTNSYSGGNLVTDGILDIIGNNSGVSGNTTLEGGTLDIGSSTALGSGNFVSNGTVSLPSTFDNTTGNALSVSAGLALNSTSTLNFVGSSNITFNGASTIAASVVPILDILNGTLTIDGNIASTNGGLTVSGLGTLVLAGTDAYTGTTTLNSGNLTITGLVGGGTIGLLSAGGGVNVFEYAPSAGGTQIVNNVTGPALRNTFVVSAAGGSTTLNFLSINNASENDYVILGGASSTAKIQFGQPTTTFFNAVSYYGTSLASPSSSYVAYDATLGSFRAINYGVDTGSALSPGGATISSGATVAGGGSIGSSTYVQTTGAITNQTTTNIHTLTIDGGYNFTIGSGQTLTLNDGGLLKTGGNSATISGGTLTTGGPTILVVHTDEASDVLTISSAIGSSTTGGLTKQGAGELILSGTNSYGGLTIVTNGLLDITGNNSGTASSYSVEDGTLQIGIGGSVNSGASITLGDSTLSGVLTLGDSSGAVSATIGSLGVLGGSMGTGNAVVNGNTLNSAASTLTVNNAIVDIYTGVLGGSGTNNNNLNLTKTSAGTLDLTGANTYTGTTNVQNGIVQIGGSAGGLSSSTAVVLGSGATSGVLQLGDGTAAINQTVSSLTTSGSGAANAVVGGYTTNSTLTVNNNSADSYSGVIGGSGTDYNNLGLVKSGTGTLTLARANTYTGGTTVTAGKLAVNGSVVGNVAVQGGAELGGSGSVGGTISGAGAVGPGNSPGILTAASVNPSAGTSFNFEFTLAGGPTYSNAAASGNDVLHLEGGTPFSAALTTANVINLYFSQAGSGFEGGFFVDGSDTLSSALTNASFDYYVEDASGSVVYNGVHYDLTTGTETTVAVSGADFEDGTVSGYTEEFGANAVPEPSVPGLLGVGLLAAATVAIHRRSALRAS